jgi:phage shock protein A
MANLPRKFGSFIKVRLKGLLAPAEDPRQTFAYSYERQRDLLENVQVALKQIRAAKGRLEEKTNEVREKLPDLQGEARKALIQDQEDRARIALERRALVAVELESLESQLREVELEERRLSLIEGRLSSQIEAFYARQEVIAARYSAAEAQVRIQEALTGLSEELSDLGKALEETELKTEEMQARAFAIDRLVDAGVLDRSGENLLESSDEELALLGVSNSVSEQLESLKQEISQQRNPEQE